MLVVPSPAHTLLLDSLNGSSDKLPQIAGYNPESQVLSSGPRGSNGHDGSSFSYVPATSTDARQSTTQDKVLLRSAPGTIRNV
jgi:hypothetical protein